MNFLRWILANITGTTLGILIGSLIALNGFNFISNSFHFFDCSGIPCDDRTFPTIILAGITGGVIGGIVGYVTCEKLTRRNIKLNDLIRYAALGGLLWPTVIVLFFCSIFVFNDLQIKINSAFSHIFSSNRIFSEVYDDIILFVYLVLVPGIIIGTTLSVLRRIRQIA